MRFLNCDTGKIEHINKKVAVIGGGASGLAAAGELVCKGYEVHVYDEMPEAGGFLLFGISDYEIPRESVKDGIKELRDAGVVFHLNTSIGKDNFEGLIKNYDAVLIATGSWRCKKVRIPLPYPVLIF